MSSCCDEVLENLRILNEGINAAGADGLSNSDDLTRIINTCSESFEKFHNEYSSGENYLWESSPCVLFEAVDTWSATLMTLQKDYETSIKDNRELQKKVDSLEQKFSSLKEAATSNKDKLVLGQVAFDVDRSIPKLVIDPVLGICHNILRIKDMDSALKGDEDIFKEEQKIDCQKRWEKLKAELGWSGKVFRYVKGLKQSRITVAHPTIDEDIVRSAVNTFVKCNDRETFRKLFQIYKETQQRLK